MTTIDIATLLPPISEDVLSCGDLEFNQDFQDMQHAASSKEEQVIGDTVIKSGAAVISIQTKRTSSTS